ncbi:MAG: Cna B-type domain-containing protein [Firmicutes bacterium]|nr:Cna B-type domain-containing protein [Bacillota bacterium]
MKRGLRTALMGLLVTLLCFSVAAPARAGEVPSLPVDVEIPIIIYMEGDTLPVSDTVSATIEGITANAPMPQASTIEIVCKGWQTHAKFTIPVDRLGVYQYKLTLHGGQYPLAEYGEDSVYYVTVSVTNDMEDYDGFNVTVAIHTDPEGQSKKYCAATDTNCYLTPIKLTVVKKWVDQKSTRPASIQVDLLCDGEVVAGKTLTLNSKTGWQGSWEGLDPRHTWTVQETKVPAGYTASYQQGSCGRIWYITNTGSLLQTGALNWPVPVLAVGGILLAGFGVAMLTRKRKDPDA